MRRRSTDEKWRTFEFSEIQRGAQNCVELIFINPQQCVGKVNLIFSINSNIPKASLIYSDTDWKAYNSIRN